MTDSPLGGFDFNAILGKAQEMQANLAQAQERLAEATVIGTVGGGAVSVTLTGAGELQSVDIKAGEFDGTDPDSLTDLSDLIVAAYRDAKAQAEALAQENFSSGFGDLTAGLPGLGDLLGGGPSSQSGDQGDPPPMKLGF